MFLHLADSGASECIEAAKGAGMMELCSHPSNLLANPSFVFGGYFRFQPGRLFGALVCLQVVLNSSCLPTTHAAVFAASLSVTALEAFDLCDVEAPCFRIPVETFPPT